MVKIGIWRYLKSPIFWVDIPSLALQSWSFSEIFEFMIYFVRLGTRVLSTPLHYCHWPIVQGLEGPSIIPTSIAFIKCSVAHFIQSLVWVAINWILKNIFKAVLQVVLEIKRHLGRIFIHSILCIRLVSQFMVLLEVISLGMYILKYFSESYFQLRLSFSLICVGEEIKYQHFCMFCLFPPYNPLFR